MSSHREAPEISKDPVADSTDLYAFVSPDAPSTVTLIANYLPLEGPAAGPNFYEFGDDVLYEILIDNDGDARPNISFQFRFQTTIRNQKTFLYNTGPIQSLASPNWNRVQTYSLQRVDYPSGRVTVLGTDLPCPPCNVGPLSTPNYESALGAAAIQSVGGGIKAFAGQRAEGFYVDLGSIFDLGTLRPFQATACHIRGLRAPVRHVRHQLDQHPERPLLGAADPEGSTHRRRHQPDRSVEAELGHRGLDGRESPEGEVQRGVPRSALRDRALDAGVTAREPAVQRGHRPDGLQGLLELQSARLRQPVRQVCGGPRVGQPPAGPLHAAHRRRVRPRGRFRSSTRTTTAVPTGSTSWRSC